MFGGMRWRMTAVGAAAAGLVLAWAPTSGAGQAAAAGRTLPPVKHVFVIVLENQGYAATFGNPSADPYLAQTLPAEGALLTNYYGTGHESNDNYVAMVSGQAPDPQNQGDCQYYTDFVGAGTVAPQQAVGSGCVYPSSVQTVASQLSSAGRSWKGYMEDMGNVPSREASACAHPALNTQDKTQSAVPGDGYVTRHDPFVYFHGIIDDAASCAAHVVPLGSPTATSGLAADLASAATTPNLSFIVPDACDDGHDYPCTNEPSGASALADIDTFLQTWVPKIQASPAYQEDGLLAIVFDEASSSDSSACCNETPGPNSPSPGINGPGGGRTGALLLSPFIAPGTQVTTGYNHYGLLGSVEDLFGLSRLGMAQTVPATFGSDVFTAYKTGT
ncbi:MAG TPA: alkaline phosphatase family protein [Acidimicrobiales bacterium]|nr:alkaline phosphatase family protein [Acidimicrobiales bacterium]